MDTTQKNREQPAARRPRQQVPQETGRVPRQQATQETSRVPRQQATQETGRVPRQQVPQETGRVPRQQAAQETGRVPRQQAAQETGRSPRQRASQETEPSIRRQENAGQTALKSRPESQPARQRPAAAGEIKRPSSQRAAKGKTSRKKTGLMQAITGLFRKPASGAKKQEKPAQRSAARSPERKAPPAENVSRAETPRSGAPRTEAPRAQSRSANVPETRHTQTAGATRKPAPQRTSGRKRKEEITDLSTKKRAYGNSKPKKKSTFTLAREMVASTVEKRKARNKAKKGGRQSQPAPAIIYTQPKTFNRTRLLVQMLTVTAVVAAMVAGLSVFFKVENITVTGAEVYSAWSIREASGIKEGDNLLTFSHARAGALIKANRPYVKTVRFGIKLPDTVNIIIEEEDVVYAVEDSTGSWWLMNSDGEVVEQTNKSKAANYTKILGITLENPTPGRMAVAVEAAPQVTSPSEGTDPTTAESLPVITTGAERLATVLDILEALEANDIVGEAASVDVTRLEDIILWYGSRYQVNLGDVSNIEYKIACMNDAILQLSEFDSGILDISFTIWPDQVGYTPFS